MTRIFRPTTWIKELRSDGFTLIEVLVVLGIIAMMSIFALPSLTGYFQLSLSAAARELSTTVKEAYNASILTGKVYRLAYDLETSEYWVESGPAGALLDTDESRKKDERRKKFSDKDKAKNLSTGYSLDRTITRKKMGLPRGVVYEDVVTEQSKDPILKGQAATHFFPHGLTEQTIIHLKDNANHHSSLVIQSISGSSFSYDRYVKGDEAFGKK